MIKYLAILASLAAQTLAVKSFGRCPKPTLQSDFDISQYVGTWYEIARDKTLPFEYGDCVKVQYASLGGNLISVHNSQLNPTTGAIDSIYGKAKCSGAQCNVNFFVFKLHKLNKHAFVFYTGDYRVLSTDYSTYAIVYSCTNYLIAKTEAVWILSRTETLDAATLATAQSIITSMTDYSLDNFYYTVQGGSCTYA